MYATFYSCLIIFWILDILNMPFMDYFDNEIPINFLAWVLILTLIPSAKKMAKINRQKRIESCRNGINED